MVGPHEPLRIRTAQGRIELDRVHGIAEVGRHFDAIAHLDRLAARLEVLACETAHLHHRQGCGIREDDGHLQHGLEPGPNRVRRVRLEGLGAVTPHEHERLSC